MELLLIGILVIVSFPISSESILVLSRVNDEQNYSIRQRAMANRRCQTLQSEFDDHFGDEK